MESPSKKRLKLESKGSILPSLDSDGIYKMVCLIQVLFFTQLMKFLIQVII